MKDETCICPGRYETDFMGQYVRRKSGRRIYHHHPDCKPHDKRLKNDPKSARKHLIRMRVPTLWDHLESVAS